ncbi:hypothetical protein [Microbacterium sp.]|uniref:hypothetical protein n=1 Tax=Microbacterium sp. TaxID=51671 RepID=UPI0028B135EA|nr:hypothetical protein [Microbacterium sp.]
MRGRSVDRGSAWWRRPWFWGLVVLLSPVAAMLVWSLVVLVWIGLHTLAGLPLPPAIEQTVPLGAVGDTFGGLLGPILNTLVLVVTISVALGQRRHVVAEREANVEVADRARAEQVTAWVAETAHSDQQGSYLGVVVINNGSTLVRDVDLVVTVKNGESPLELRNREAVIPPGTWFLPINRAHAEDRGEAMSPTLGSEPSSDWAAAVAVDTSGHLRVDLPDDDRPRAPLASHVLGVHLPITVDGQKRPYYEIQLLRFTLDGAQWWRDGGGRLSRSIPPAEAARTANWESEFSPLASVPRPPSEGPKQIHRKDPGVQSFISQFAARLTGRNADDISRNVRYATAEPLRGVGIGALRISRAGQGIAFYESNSPDAPTVLWLSGNTNRMPAVIDFVEEWRERAERQSVGPLISELVDYKDPIEMADQFVARLPSHLAEVVPASA